MSEIEKNETKKSVVEFTENEKKVIESIRARKRMTPKKAGQVFGVSPKEAKEIEVSAIRKLCGDEETLSRLAPRQAMVLILISGVIDGRPRTIEEVAQIFMRTPEEIKKIESKAVFNLVAICKQQPYNGKSL